MECPIKHGDGAEMMIAYGAGTLAPETESALERHIQSCAKCREIARAQKEVWSSLDTWTPAAVSPSFDERLYQRIAIEEQSKWWRRMFRANWSWRPAMPVAAACAALAVVFLLKGPATDQQPLPQTQQRPQIEQVERALADMEMLKQLSVTTLPEPAASSEKI